MKKNIALFLSIACSLFNSCYGDVMSTMSPLDLVDLRGRLGSDPIIRDLINSSEIRKNLSLRIERYFPSSKITELDYFECTEIPVKIVLEQRVHTKVNQSEITYVRLVRIGYAYRDKEFPFLSSTFANRGFDLDSLVDDNLSELDSLLPFGLSSNTHYDSVGSVPYVRETIDMSPDGSGYVSYYDGLESPLPITIHFYKWKVCGIDIHGAPWVCSRREVSSKAVQSLLDGTLRRSRSRP